MMQTWTVSDLTAHIKALILSDDVLRDVWIQGEVSNFVRYSSGHCYFSLKDAGATLSCVMWRSVADSLPALPQNGDQVLAHGHVNVYEARGAYQLYVDYIQPAGVGDLHAEFERLKSRLEAEGLFAAERKRPLPRWPKRIGVVTSPHGAALRDIVRVIRSRFPNVEIVLSPTLVQGSEAPPQIVRALDALIQYGRVDVIVLARGGGSLEDLWAFNDERVARAIARSPIPVVSGVGHETDFTIADFVADVRAPTPSAAAAAVVPDGKDLDRQLRAYESRLTQLVRAYVEERRQHLLAEERALRVYSPQARVEVARQNVDDLTARLHRVVQHQLTFARAQVKGWEDRLEALSPLRVLERGYALIHRADGSLVTSVHQVGSGEHVWIRLRDGRLETWVVDKEEET